MALSLNNYAKYTTPTGGLLGAMRFSPPIGAASGNRALNVYLNTVSYGSFNDGGYSSSTGRAIFYTASTSQTLFTLSGNNIIFSSSGGSPQLTPSLTGTLSWFSIVDQNTGAIIISDSITTIGGGGILQVSSLSVTNGTPIICTFSLSLM